MLDKSMQLGIEQALTRFKLANIPTPGILDRLKSFGSGQLGAAKDLFHNMRGGLGGKMNPAIAGPHGEAANFFGKDLMGEMHRTQALGNLRTLAPSMAIGGGAYMLHRHNQAQEDEARQRAMMAQQGYAQGM